MKAEQPPDDPLLPHSRVTKFVRQITHDVRNGLNAIDLEAAFLAEIIADAEALGEIKKLRALVGSTAKSLQQLSAQFSTPALNVIDLPARDFLSAFRERVEQRFPSEVNRVEWKNEFEEENVNIDFEQLSHVLLELLQNAFQFADKEGQIVFHARTVASDVIFEVAQPMVTIDSDPAEWGREPLVSTRRGSYGLGLFRARRIVASHGGTLTLRHAGGLLTATVALPVLIPIAAR